jgi:hypothetical protein
VFALNRLAAAERIMPRHPLPRFRPRTGAKICGKYHGVFRINSGHCSPGYPDVHRVSCAYAILIEAVRAAPAADSSAYHDLASRREPDRAGAQLRSIACRERLTASATTDQRKPAGARWFRADYIYRPTNPMRFATAAGPPPGSVFAGHATTAHFCSRPGMELFDAHCHLQDDG